MPQAAAITINDGAATPVAHTFTPIGKDEKGVMWFEQTTPTPASPLGAKRIGYRQIRILDSKKQLTGVAKAVYTIHVPTLETLANNSAGIVPPPTMAYKEVARIEFDLPERGLKQERKDTRVLVINLLGHATPVLNIDDLQPTYS